jgi:hypothetical protein
MQLPEIQPQNANSRKNNAGAGPALKLEWKGIRSELHVHTGVERTAFTRHHDAPGDTLFIAAGHGYTLADIGPTQRVVVELVEEVLDSKVKAHLTPLVAAAQMHQTVGVGLDFVSLGRDVILVRHHFNFDGVGPAALALLQGDLGVQRHDAVEVVAGGLVFSADIVQQALGGEVAVGGAVGQPVVAGEVHAVQAR